MTGARKRNHNSLKEGLGDMVGVDFVGFGHNGRGWLGVALRHGASQVCLQLLEACESGFCALQEAPVRFQKMLRSCTSASEQDVQIPQADYMSQLPGKGVGGTLARGSGPN